MALTAAIDSQRGVNESGNRKSVIATLSYVGETHSNGYALTKEIFGFQAVLESVVFLSATPADTDQYKWDPTNGTIRIYTEGGGTYAEETGSLTRDLLVQAEGY